jgi:hypothetical protein
MLNEPISTINDHNALLTIKPLWKRNIFPALDAQLPFLLFCLDKVSSISQINFNQLIGPCHLQICRLKRQNLSAIVGKLTAEVRYLSSKNRLSCSTAIFFAVQKMFCYHLRQKARQCSVLRFLEKLLNLSVCSDNCNCGLMRSLTCC